MVFKIKHMTNTRLVYHGTTLEIRRQKIITSEIGRDFGFAFYTMDIKEQAERWAVRRAKVQTRLNRKKEQAIVNVYEWSESHILKEKIFRDASMDWLVWAVRIIYFWLVLSGKSRKGIEKGDENSLCMPRQYS